MKISNSLKILFSVPFLIIGVILYCKLNSKELENLLAPFITASLTIATFSISFSFLQYQFSQYKSLLKSISIKQLLFSYLTIFIALIPLFVLFYKKEYVPAVSLFSIPILAYSTLLLWIIAAEESNPLILLNRTVENAKIEVFLKNVDEKYSAIKVEQEKFQFSKGDESPIHDIYNSSFNSTVIPNDPFHFINNIIDTSLNNMDLEVYELALEDFLKLIDKAIENKNSKDFYIERLIENSFERLTFSTLQLAKNKSVHNIFIIKISNYLKEKALIQKQTKTPYTEMVAILTKFAKELLQNNNPDGVVAIASLYRQLSQKGIYDSLDKKIPFLFDAHLAIYPQQIKKIGQEAVKQNDSNIFFRCLEDIGFLGCSGIKNNHYDVSIECLQTLVQLGREARAAKMLCFWTRCALEPVDHAEQRIWWMLSWVYRLENKDQIKWIRSFETAYSRLRGFERKIKINIKNEKALVDFEDSINPHIESYSEEFFHREINYSNFEDLKEFKLY